MRLTVLMGMTAWCHAQQRPSLLQVSARQTAMEKAEAESRSQTLSGFQKFTDSLVQKYKDGQSPVAIEEGSTEDKAIKKVLEYIDGFFESADERHQVDAGAMQVCANREPCGTTCHNDFKSALIGKEKERLDIQMHKMVQCMEDYQRISESCVDDCYAYDYYRTHVPLPDCVYNDKFAKFCLPNNRNYAGALCDNMIQADEEDQSTQLAEMESCLVEFYEWFRGRDESSGDSWTLPQNTAAHQFQDQERYEGIWPLYTQCDREGCIDPQSTPCQENVTEYHRDHCEHALVLNHECKDHDTCMSDCDASCDICDDIMIKANARKADNETGERIKCLLNVLIEVDKEDKTAELDACLNEAAKKKYADLASYFHLECDGFAQGTESPDVTEMCSTLAGMSISCTNAYMQGLLQMMVGNHGTLHDFDQHNKGSTLELWNSCECGHQCSSVHPDRRNKNLRQIEEQDVEEYQRTSCTLFGDPVHMTKG